MNIEDVNSSKALIRGILEKGRCETGHLMMGYEETWNDYYISSAKLSLLEALGLISTGEEKIECMEHTKAHSVRAIKYRDCKVLNKKFLEAALAS